MPEFLKNRVYHALVWPDPRPASYNTLGKSGIWGFGSLDTELLWNAQSLLPYHRDLRDFIEQREAFAKAFLIGLFPECDRILDECDSKFGKSMWGIEARINLIQARDGFAAQKAFTKEVLSHQGLGPFISYLVTWFTFRAERNVSADEFNNHVQKTSPLTTAFDHLVHLSLGLCPKVTGETAAMMLSYLAHMPIIDRYNYLVMISQALLASGASTDEQSSIGAELLPLAAKLNDHGLAKIMLACGKSVVLRNVNTDRTIALLDMYSNGDYEEAVSASWANLLENPILDHLQIGLRADASRNFASSLPDFSAASPLLALAADLRRVVSYSEEANEAVRRLDKAATTWPQASWASSLRLVLLRQRNDERVGPASREQIFHALRTNEENPILAATLEPLGVSVLYLDSLLDGQTSISVGATLSILNDQPVPALAAFRLDRVQTLRDIRAGRHDNAISSLNQILDNSPDRHAQLELGRQLVEMLMHKRDLGKAAKVAADLILMSQYVATLLPISDLVEALIEADLWGVPCALAPLSVSIVFDFYSRSISTDHDSERADAFNDFLSQQGILCASDLDAGDGRYPLEQLIHFLRYVCVPEVLDQSLNLGSTRAVEDERAKVIVKASDLLNQIGSSTPSELLEEVREIKLRQVVRETALQLDQSKVYVNVDGIRKMMDSQIREGWHRFRLFTMHENSTSSIDEMSRKIHEIMGERYQVISAAAPATEKYIMFTKMVLDIKDQFTGSREYGLDSNLSTNIRHGFIIRALRGPFVTRHLITNMATLSGEYQTNTQWVGKFELSEVEEKALVDALAQFSAEIDDQIEALTRRHLRIAGDAAADGLFVFDFTDFEVQLLMRRWEDEESHEVFMDRLFEYLWKRTEESLEYVRSHLMNVTLTSMQNSLTQLATSVGNSCPDPVSSALGSAINLVRPEIQSAVEKVASWFTLSLTQDYQDYPPHIAFDTGLATVKSYYSHLNIRTEFDAPASMMMAGWTLPHITRLFTILFENAAFHSEIEEGDLLIKGGAVADAATLKLSLSNSLSPTKDMDELSEKVSKLNAEFGRDSAQEYIRLEGGSGYPKIWKILRHDLRRDHAVEVNVTAENEFLVEIVLDARGVLA